MKLSFPVSRFSLPIVDCRLESLQNAMTINLTILFIPRYPQDEIVSRKFPGFLSHPMNLLLLLNSRAAVKSGREFISVRIPSF